jgi:hypothetical protein
MLPTAWNTGQKPAMSGPLSYWSCSYRDSIAASVFKRSLDGTASGCLVVAF